MILQRLIRSRVTVGAPFASTPLLDVAFDNQSIETVRGNATRMEFGFFSTGGDVLDLSEVQSLNLKLQPSQTQAGILADKTLAAAALDLTLDDSTWADGSKAHAVFRFSNAEMNISVGTGQRALWLVITAILANGDEVTLCGGTMTLHEDNNSAGDPPPENPGTALTVEQGDARYQPLGGGGGGAPFTKIAESLWVDLDPPDDIYYDVILGT